MDFFPVFLLFFFKTFILFCCLFYSIKNEHGNKKRGKSRPDTKVEKRFGKEGKREMSQPKKKKRCCEEEFSLGA